MPFLSPVRENQAKVTSNIEAAAAALSPETNNSYSSSAISFDDGHIRVACRVRPPNTREAAYSINNDESQRAANGRAMTGDEAVEIVNGTKRCITVLDDNATVVFSSKSTKNAKGKAVPFKFDFAVRETATQEEIFAAIGRPISAACMQGYNSTVLAYGQTGSGKSHTMFGPESSLTSTASGTIAAKESWGIVPRSIEYIFSEIAREARRSNGEMTYTCKCSFFEIFNERVFDLLDAANIGESQPQASRQSIDRSSRGSRNSSSMFQEDLAGLQVREGPGKRAYVVGLEQPVVTCVGDAIEVIQKGYRNRRVAETAMNRESSRSHAVFQLSLQSMNQSDPNGVRKSSLFTLVDLAGSERQSGTSASGDRLKEANAINKSLSTLGGVVSALVDKGEGKARHVPFRDSKLTFLLKDSLGGNSRTFIVATVSPSEEQIGESLSTLKFSERAKKITNTAIVNEDVVGNVDALKQEVGRLKQELAKEKIKYSHLAASSSEKTSPSKSSSPSSSVSSSSSSPPLVLPTDEFLTSSLDRFITIHKQSERYLQKTITLRQLNDKHTKQIHAANLMIKLLRDKLKNSPEDPMKLMDEKTTKILQELEGSMLERVEVNRWSASVGEMRREIAALKGAEDITPSMNDITVHVPNNPIGAESLKELMLNKYARDKSLGLDNGKQESANFSGTAIPWSEEAEVKFQTALQEKYTKVVEEKDVLAEQLESVMNDKANSEKPTNAPTSKFAAVMQDEFGGSSDIDVLDIKPQRTSVSKSRRSSVGRVGGRFSIGGSEVSHWSAVQESNKTIREAENKIDAVSKQLHEKSLELAEANKLNAVLAREKAELLAGGAISTPEGDSPALIEKIVSSETEIQALKDEIERIEQKRAEDQVAAEEAEAQLRELAQLEIDEAARQKLLAEKFQAEAAEEAKAASEAASEAALMRQAAEEAKEAEAVALSKVKALEDEMETLSEQMEYVNAGSEEKTMEIERLKNESNAQMQEIESNKRQLESQKADFLSLQAQIESSSKEGNSAVENLQQQLSAQMMKYAALQEDQVTAEQTLTTMTTALAKSETIATELRQQLLIAQENGNLANEAASDLKKEVWKLRDDIANVEATLNHTKVELESVKDDREEVNASLQDAERLAEELREQLDVEKDNYVETLNKQADTIAELEEALESEQQMIMEEDSKRKNDIANLEAKWRAEVDVISAKESAALARAEQAEAEVGVLRNDTQRDVQEAERELLTTKQALKSEEEKRSKLEKDMAVQTAKYEEQVCKVQELKLEVENSTNSYNTIFARTVEHDVQLAAAEREAEKMREIAESAELSKNELMEQLTLVEARVEELTLACVEAKEVATRAEAKAENSKIMEQEAYEKSLEFERTYDIMKADMDKANEKIKSLTEELYSYTGHSNQNQKIHIMSKLRNENNELKNEIEDLRKLKVSPLPKVKPVLDDDLLASKLESEAAMRVADVMRAEDEAAAGTENSENAKPLLSPKKSSAAVPAVPPSPLTEKNLN